MYFSFLGSFTYPNTDGTAIAVKITNTTMISTNVKPFLLDFFLIFSLFLRKMLLIE